MGLQLFYTPELSVLRNASLGDLGMLETLPALAALGGKHMTQKRAPGSPKFAGAAPRTPLLDNQSSLYENEKALGIKFVVSHRGRPKNLY